MFHRQPRELPADQLSPRAFNRFVKPNNLTHFSSGESVTRDAKPGSRIQEAHLREAGCLCRSGGWLRLSQLSESPSERRAQNGTVALFSTHA